ncbi:DivIVA domain-containing protein [Mycobacterium marinum]|uniref:DivIVA domain-containing protein n=1 Tax=Mycobacterium marinum TaxID=1781 RepID=UPI000B97589F|nr:DivIVA domain-containing protein [Mycobacterium marinum]MDC8983504.1 DivIVA domain-containing protein [Mycobacterium marinum]MDC8993085.1 DivIVA domain-containing protein [Mycobacterium marinum]MDC9000575.1 DivIVA domain-containing protein [Mycobacterium marinum]MDC9010962.1 DivIVA domain-containing protein [Mycobacterium marinum]MDC9016809.1 DivIVA domain-containing protein [Mycobacterium marinum]
MALVLLYLVVLVLVAVVLFGVASLLFGRGEQLPPLPRATTSTVLPAYGVTRADVDAVKFTQVLRGYKTSEVDWVLDRLGRELEELRGQLAAVHASSTSESPAGAEDSDAPGSQPAVSNGADST